MKSLCAPSSFFAHLRIPAALGLAGTLALGWAWSGVPVEPFENPFAGDEWVLPSAQPSLRPGDGAGLVTSQCSLCHSLDYIATQPALTRAQWTAGIEKMRTRFGAPIQTNQVSALVEYLTRNYGKP